MNFARKLAMLSTRVMLLLNVRMYFWPPGNLNKEPFYFTNNAPVTVTALNNLGIPTIIASPASKL